MGLFGLFKNKQTVDRVGTHETAVVDRFTPNVFKKPVTVEEIHNAVDEVEDGFLDMINHIIETNNVNKSKVTLLEEEVRKAALLRKLGFDNSELIQNMSDRENEIKRLNDSTLSQKETLNLFDVYKKSYPNQKIMPFKLFKEVLDKYNLIYAPNKAYIKDVPEKNLMEILNAGSLKEAHSHMYVHYVDSVNLDLSHNSKDREDEANKIILDYYNEHPEKRFISYDKYNTGGHNSTEAKTLAMFQNMLEQKDIIIYSSYSRIRYSVLSRSGIFTAAPKSHFDLTNLTSDGERGYYEGVSKLKVNINVQDPIAFEFLKGCSQYPEGFVRILTKWGTEDDQSYLDESLQK